MMRKVEQAMVAAIQRRESRAIGNTMVTVEGNAVKVYLHGNLIADLQMTPAGWVGAVTFAGWPTRTTASRINAVLSGIGSTVGVGLKGGKPEVRLLYRTDKTRTMPCKNQEWLTVGTET